MIKKGVMLLMIFGLIFFSEIKLFPVDIGVKAGLSQVDGTMSQEIPGVDFSSRSEFIVGAFISVDLFRILAVQPEVYYVTKGVNGTEGDEFSEYKFSYLEIPLLFKFKIPIVSDIKPVVFAGPYAAFNLSAKEIQTENGVKEETDLEDFVKKMDYGLVIGAGIEYTLKFGKLILDVRYTLGLVNMMQYLDIITSGVMDDDDWFKTRSFTIMIGLAF